MMTMTYVDALEYCYAK